MTYHCTFAPYFISCTVMYCALVSWMANKALSTTFCKLTGID